MPYKDKQKQKRYVRNYMQNQREILSVIKQHFPTVYKEARKQVTRKEKKR